MKGEGVTRPESASTPKGGKRLRPLAFLEQMRERYGDVFEVGLPGGDSLLVVSDPVLVERVFQAPAKVLHPGEANRRGLGWLYGDHSLALLDERPHLDHRRILLPAFHGDRMAGLADAVREVADRRLATWPLGEDFAALPLLRELTLEIAIRTAFGAEDRPGIASLRDTFLELHAPATIKGGGAASRRLVNEAGALVESEVARRRGGSRRRDGDVLGILLDARLEDGSPLSDAEIRDEVVTMLAAGYETTATALAWTLERLARAPQTLAAVEREAEDGGGPLTDAAIHETLRMRPPVPMSARLVKQPFRLGPRELAPGTVIGVSALLVHHREDIYPEPQAFRPERFLGKQPGTYTWIPFGGGVRRCPGAGFALRELRVVLGSLLSRATLRTVDPAPEGMFSGKNTITPADGARISLEPRSPRRSVAARWSEASTWVGDDLRREVFFFQSAGVDLYGSLFAATEPTRPYGVVTCQSWGTDADRSDPLVRSVALEMAKLGGAGMVFHYPGFGDSYGDLAVLSLADLGEAARDATAAASRRCPGLTWIFAGFMFGASVACLARSPTGALPLLLVQPELKPGAYFRWLASTSEPLAPGPNPRQMMEVGDTPGMAYGYPIPRRILEHADEADRTVASALAGSSGGGAAINYAESGDPGPLPARFERIEVPGTWRFGLQNHPRLATAAAEWLDRRTRDN